MYRYAFEIGVRLWRAEYRNHSPPHPFPLPHEFAVSSADNEYKSGEFAGERGLRLGIGLVCAVALLCEAVAAHAGDGPAIARSKAGRIGSAGP